MDDDLHVAPLPAVTVAAAAHVELSGLICISCRANLPPDCPLSAELAARAGRVWGDGHPMLAELVVLADAAGAFTDLAVEPFLDRLREPLPITGELPLPSETPAERLVIRERLRRLASDRRLRMRVVDTLTEMWSGFADTWERGGRDLAVSTAADWGRRLSEGADAMDLLPDGHLARRDPAFGAMVRAAQRDGTLWLSPTLISRGYVVSVPGRLSVSAAVRQPDPVVARREELTRIADTLRALAEPTRLTILAQLAEAPAGVGELAKALHIAQPTASVHLRRLREAGLVEVRRDGSRSVYSARPQAVRAMLEGASSGIAGAMGDAES